MQAAQKLVAATGQQCLAQCVDVRQPQTLAAAVEEALKHFQRIDILVNSEQLGWAGAALALPGCQQGPVPARGLRLPSAWLMLEHPGSPWAQSSRDPL